MNTLFTIGFLLSIGLIIIFNPELAVKTILDASNNSLKLSIKMVVMFVFWLGIINIVEKLGLLSCLARIFKKPLKFLLGNVNSDTIGFVTMNISANFLGVGNASTPMGIAAINSMKSSETATSAMVMFFVINATSLQLVPTTVISLRQLHGAATPYDIILPSIFVSLITMALGILLVKTFVKDDL
ncbi:MAG: hypothetical protein RR458_03120 [Clostridia bacterium]